MDTTLLLIAIVLLIGLGSLALFLLKSINKKSFTAKDGTAFSTQAACNEYESLLIKLTPLYSDNLNKINAKNLSGLSSSFVYNLRKGGFNDINTLLKYKKDWKLFSSLINSNN